MSGASFRQLGDCESWTVKAGAAVSIQQERAVGTTGTSKLAVDPLYCISSVLHCGIAVVPSL